MRAKNILLQYLFQQSIIRHGFMLDRAGQTAAPRRHARDQADVCAGTLSENDPSTKYSTRVFLNSRELNSMR